MRCLESLSLATFSIAANEAYRWLEANQEVNGVQIRFILMAETFHATLTRKGQTGEWVGIDIDPGAFIDRLDKLGPFIFMRLSEDYKRLGNANAERVSPTSVASASPPLPPASTPAP